MQILGIDIGGANIKLADAHGRSLAEAFPMWSTPELLGQSIAALIERFERQFDCLEKLEALAVTMTGELADCFPTRREGVTRILEQIAVATPTAEIFVYSVEGRWLSPAEAKRQPWDVAASNWFALAQWLVSSGVTKEQNIQLIVDVGSTTVDIIPVTAASVATEAKTDRDRLQLGQLVYTGMQRTPVAAIVNSVKVSEVDCPVMAERFATSDDAYVALGLVPEAPGDHDSADGRPRTRACARGRLARMIGEDVETLDEPQIDEIAEQVVDAQSRQIYLPLERNLSPAGNLQSESQALLISGHGRPLMERVRATFLKQCRFVWLAENVSEDAARCGPALAVAWLLEHRRHPPGQGNESVRRFENR